MTHWPQWFYATVIVCYEVRLVAGYVLKRDWNGAISNLLGAGFFLGVPLAGGFFTPLGFAP